ncbi:unnamed protein product [Clonostachys solani]|uniref:Uncharacterized protein n=1 Tax=Clonostachys solani TaxID=160281 RepID=A0A9N9YWS1_9HYPO|nr:unnamed protein product [Clonostachys solani]
MTLQPLFLVFILMAASISAMRVQVAAKWGKTMGQRTSKLVEIADSRADSVVAGMGTWSQGRYQAHVKTDSRGRGVPPMLIINPTRDASNANEGHAMVAEMQSLMRQNANSRSPSPAPATGVNSAPPKKAPPKKAPPKKAPSKKAPSKQGKRSYYIRSRYNNY